MLILPARGVIVDIEGSCLQALATTFAESWGQAGDLDLDRLERTLSDMCAAARRRWPGVVLDDASFVAHLAARLPAGDPIHLLGEVHGTDLFLACACARAAPGAVETFDRELLSRLPALIATLRLDRRALDEARQLVAQRLLVAREDGPPRIAEYAGRGPLEGWLRIAALRSVINARRDESRHEHLDRSTVERRLLPTGADAELEVIKRLHKDDFVGAFRAALDELTARERALLGLHFMEGVSTVELAKVYRVHRTTVGRWLETAQQALLEGTRRNLRASLKLSDSECESLIAMLMSKFDLTLRTLLDKPVDAPG